MLPLLGLFPGLLRRQLLGRRLLAGVPGNGMLANCRLADWSLVNVLRRLVRGLGSGLDHPRLDYPRLDYPRLDYPKLGGPRLDWFCLGFGLRTRSRFRLSCSSGNRSGNRRGHGRGFLPFTLYRLTRNFRCRRGHCRCLRPASTPWRRRWRRWRRCERFEEFQGLRARTQFPVQQQHENIARNLRIFRQLRRDQQLRHFGQWNSLLDLPPLGEEVLDLLRDGLLP